MSALPSSTSSNRLEDFAAVYDGSFEMSPVNSVRYSDANRIWRDDHAGDARGLPRTEMLDYMRLIDDGQLSPPTALRARRHRRGSSGLQCR
jgi:hypothetical protein